jgi:hypothetical protein
MVITIENPTAEGIIEALKQQIPTPEFNRMKKLLNEPEETTSEEETEWHAISQGAASRFFEDEA